MTFDGFETGLETGRPVQAFLFALGGTNYAYTNGEDQQIVDAVTYVPETVSASKIVVTRTQDDQDIEITLPASNAFAQLYKGLPPGQRATMTMREFHRTDGNAVVVYKGFVRNAKFEENTHLVKLKISPISSAFSRSIPNRNFQGLCPLMVYSAACGLIEGNFEELEIATVVSGNTITVPTASNIGVASDYWEAGFVEYNNDFRQIVEQAEDVFTLLLPFNDSPLGQVVRILPGCKHRIVEDCQTKFSNEINHRGFTQVPTKNPHESGLI